MRFLLCLLLVIAFSASPAMAAAPSVEEPVAVIRALDKVTARVADLDVQVGKPLSFGNIIITVRTCRDTPPEETPESAAFLEVDDFVPGAAGKPVFRGWMFASSPSLSAMEHPVYDLWVVGCKAPALTSSPASAPALATKK